jgi:hypothetical protein
MQEMKLQQGTTTEPLAEELAKTGGAKRRIHCSHCGSHRIFRVFRQGYLQEKIYPFFGFYPWKCKTCSGCMMLRLRESPQAKREKHVDSGAGESSTPTTT